MLSGLHSAYWIYDNLGLRDELIEADQQGRRPDLRMRVLYNERLPKWEEGDRSIYQRTPERSRQADEMLGSTSV